MVSSVQLGLFVDLLISRWCDFNESYTHRILIQIFISRVIPKIINTPHIIYQLKNGHHSQNEKYDKGGVCQSC